jgi:hypothetical protein
MKESNHTTLAKAVADKPRNWKIGQATTGHTVTPSGKCIHICEAREKQMLLDTKNVSLTKGSVSEHYSCCQNESHRHADTHTQYSERGIC